MSAVILISGVGQLGSRYLQGMADCRNSLDIYVQDISKHSLKIAKQRWERVFLKGNSSARGGVTESAVQHKVTYLTSFEKIPKQIDIAVVATNADIRPLVIKQIATNSEVRNWVLEKVLAQTLTALDEILTLTQNSSGAWANIPRRMMFWHQQIREKLRGEIPLHITGSGSLWGLACNGIHYLDLVNWWTGETLCKIDVTQLDSQWIESKRKGFFEITGKITAIFSRGTILILESKSNGRPFTLEVETQRGVWKINEEGGVAYGPVGFLIKGNFEMQSTMTTRLIDSLLKDSVCELPNLTESIELHRVFLRSLLEHWNDIHGTNVKRLLIT